MRRPGKGERVDSQGTANYKQALKWYTKAAEQGNVAAQHKLGLMYEDGRGTPKDYKQAVKWYTEAAKQWRRTAQVDLGLMYKNGKGVAKNYTQAYMWFSVAAVMIPSVPSAPTNRCFRS